MADAKLRADINQNAGLRERKKARTRASIREHALRLFTEQGYSETTVEQISAAAEVSPSTFFRYFPTKEDVVLQDDIGPRTLEVLERQPPSLSTVAAFRAAWRELLESFSPEELEFFRESTALTLTVPEIRARAMDDFALTIDQIAVMIARRAGRSERDLNVRVLAGAVVGVIMAATMPWAQLVSAGETADARALFERIDEGLALLESGLPV